MYNSLRQLLNTMTFSHCPIHQFSYLMISHLKHSRLPDTSSLVATIFPSLHKYNNVTGLCSWYLDTQQSFSLSHSTHGIMSILQLTIHVLNILSHNLSFFKYYTSFILSCSTNLTISFLLHFSFHNFIFSLSLNLIF